MLVKFDPKEKGEMFDALANHFYKQNFGQMSKSDVETLMFHFYIKQLVKQNENESGVLDYNSCLDYKISKDLGITPQRVASLKVKSQLLYPIEFSWERSFETLLDNIRFDRKAQKVIIPIPDPNLYYEVQNYLEEQGAYIEKQLNRKLLQLRVEYYICLLMNLYGDEKTRDQLISEVKKELKKKNEIEVQMDDRNIGKVLLESGISITSLVGNLCSIFSQGTVLGRAFASLLEKLK